MSFDDRFYVAKGIPKAIEISMKLIDPNRNLTLGRLDYSSENPHAIGFLERRRDRIESNLGKKKSLDTNKIREICEREFLVHAGLTYCSLLSGSDADPNAIISPKTGLPIIVESNGKEFEELYLRLRNDQSRSMNFFNRLEQSDRVLGQAIDYLSINASERASFVDPGNIQDIITLILGVAKRGTTELYELLTRQNIINATKGKVDF